MSVPVRPSGWPGRVQHRVPRRRTRPRRLRGIDIANGGGRRGRRREQGAGVGLHDAEPAVEIPAVVGAQCIGDAESGACEGSEQLGHQLLGGLGIGQPLKRLPKLRLSRFLGTRPVAQLVQRRRVEGLDRGAADPRAAEGATRRQVDGVALAVVTGRAAAEVDARA